MTPCTRCGTDLPGESKFCPQCGAGIPISPPGPPAPPPPPPAPGPGTHQRPRWLIPAAGLAAVIVVIVVIVVSGSGSDPGSSPATTAAAPIATTSTAGPTTSDPDPVPADLAPGGVAVYFTSSTGSSSTYVAEYGITLETSAGAVLRYLPATDELTVVDTYTSASYARRIVFPLTYDGRLFLIDHGRETFSSDLYELDANGDHHRLDPPGRMILTEASSSASLYAVTGDRVLWRSPRRYETLVGNTGGDLYGRDYGGTAGLLQQSGSPSNVGELHAAGGEFYRIYHDSTTDQVTATRADPATGETGRIMSTLELGSIGAGNWQFAVDGNGLWLVATLGGDDTGLPATANLYHQPWGPDGSTADADLVYEGVLAEEEDWVVELDTDRGWVLMALSGPGDDSFIIYDHRTGTATTHTLGIDSVYAQILVGR